MKNEGRGATLELIMVMVFVIFFGLFALSLIASGAGVSERIAGNIDAQQDARLALNYVNVRVRQNDAVGRVEVATIPRTEAHGILIRHRTAAADFDRWIYFENGRLLEALTDPGQYPLYALSTAIAEIYSFNVSYQSGRNIVDIAIEYEYNGEIQYVSKAIRLRSDRSDGIIIL